MKQFLPRKQAPRLVVFDYVGGYTYFITTNTENWDRVLHGGVAEMCADRLYRAAGEREFDILAYTFMPDHAHILASGTTPTSDMRSFVKHFKQLAGYAYTQSTGQTLWQRGFYEHVLRSDEAIEPIAAYTWHNPVRAGLAAVAMDYLYSGPWDALKARTGGAPFVDSVPLWLSEASYDRPEGPSLREGLSSLQANTLEALQSGHRSVDSVPLWLSGASYDRPEGPSVREFA